MVNKLFPIINIFFYVITILISYFLISENDISKMEQIIHFYNFYTKNKSARLIKTILSIDPKNDCPENSFPLVLMLWINPMNIKASVCIYFG